MKDVGIVATNLSPPLPPVQYRTVVWPPSTPRDIVKTWCLYSTEIRRWSERESSFETVPSSDLVVTIEAGIEGEL